MRLFLALASVVWPVVLGADVWHRAHGGGSAASVVLQAATSRICHRRPERSFHSAGAQWPVCARCTGLYLSAPVGALVALAGRRRVKARAPTWLAAAAVPTIVTLVVEWTGLVDPGNVVRAVTALPLGAAIAFVIVRAAGPRGIDRID
jgi:uncharacterized membrane protein